MLTKNHLCRPLVILPALIIVYFLAFPADLEVLAAPLTIILEVLTTQLTRLLVVSRAVSPWLYILLGVLILSRSVTHVWGRKS